MFPVFSTMNIIVWVVHFVLDLFWVNLHIKRKQGSKLILLFLIPVYWHCLLKRLFNSSVQFISVTHVQLFVTPWTAARQASLSITKSRSLLKLMSIQLMVPSNHLILCCPLILLPAIFPSLRESLFQWVSSSHQVVKVLEFQLQPQSFQWMFRIDFL